MASTCVDSLLHNLDLLDPQDGDVQKLKLELQFLRPFLWCAGKWKDDHGNSNSDEDVRMRISLLFIERTICKYAQGILSLCPRGEDESSIRDFNSMVRIFQRCIELDRQEINQVYPALFDCSSLSSSPRNDELVEFIDSLIENLVILLKRFEDSHQTWELEIKALAQTEEDIEHLEEKVRFLSNFIRFVTLRGTDDRKLDGLLTRILVVSVNAAYFSYLCWSCLCSNIVNTNTKQILDKMSVKISELLQKIKPVDPLVREIYIQVLAASKPSGSPLTQEMDKRIAGNFIDSLLGNLWELLNCGTSFLVSMKDQFQILYEGLRFLRTILRDHQEKYDELYEMKDSIGAVVSEAGIVVCLLSVNEMKQGLAKETNHALSDFLEKIRLIKEEVAKKYPVTSTLNFRMTNELGFIDFVLENLKELRNSKGNSITFIEDQIQVVERDLVFLRSFLDKIVDLHNQHEELRALWSRAIKVAYKVEFVIDSIVVGDIESSPMLFSTIIAEMKHIKIEALEINDTKRYEMEERQKFTKSASLFPSQRSIPTISEVIVSLDDEKETIINLLTRGSMQREIVSIVGMPGLGKTTLAKTIYSDSSVICHFHIRAWCCVSQVYCQKDLLIEILGHIVPKLSPKYLGMDENDLALELYRHLKTNRYLIVLDDLWDTKAWSGLESSFTDDSNGSRVLITSRLHNVASKIKPDTIPHPLRPLTDDESLELLQKKLFDEERWPPALRPLGIQIAKNCKGLPLIVVIIAGILKHLEKNGWDEVLNSISSGTVSLKEQCRNTLEISYKHLPDYLKPCLLYFGAFREDQEIPTLKLVQLWIAEGFVQKTKLKRLEDVAEEYLMDLIGRSLVMVSKQRAVGGVKTCRIHDLLHEFFVAKAREENFLHLLCGYDELLTFSEAGNLRRLCIYSKAEHFKQSRLFCSRVRSLLVFSHGGGDIHGYDGYKPHHYNISYVFRIFKLLRVLDLSQINLGGIFPTEIELLVQLRYLAVQVWMHSIPPSIANLLNLETFILKGHVDILLPDTIWKMKKLRHLHINGVDKGLIFPNGNLEDPSGLYNLDTISSPCLSFDQRLEKIMRKLPNIRKMKCQISGSESVTSTREGNRILALNFLSSLESLNVGVRNNFCLFNVMVECQIGFPLNLKELTLKKFFWPWREISRIGELPNLEVLRLLTDSIVGTTWDMKKEGEFPKLRFLKLYSLDIVEWTGDGDYFPRLQRLVLQECRKLEEVPSCLGYSSTLEEIQVLSCHDSAIRSVKQIQEEQMNMGNEGIKIIVHP